MGLLKKRYALLLCVTAPFFILDTVVFAGIQQSIWEQIPMGTETMAFWCMVTAVYLISFRTAIGVFYYSCAALVKGISNKIRERVYERFMVRKIGQKDSASVSSVINNDLRYREAKKMAALELPDEKQLNYKEENLSGGEKQKIELARAWYSGRKLWIMDEPYSALDQKSLLQAEREILSRPEQTSITISHVVNENRNSYHKVFFFC